MKTDDENSDIKCEKIYPSIQPKSGWILLVALFLRVAKLILRNNFCSKGIFCVGGLSLLYYYKMCQVQRKTIRGMVIVPCILLTGTSTIFFFFGN